MTLLRESRRQARHSEAVLSSPPGLLRPSLPASAGSLLPLEQCRSPSTEEVRAQLVVVLMREAGGTVLPAANSCGNPRCVYLKRKDASHNRFL